MLRCCCDWFSRCCLARPTRIKTLQRPWSALAHLQLQLWTLWWHRIPWRSCSLRWPCSCFAPRPTPSTPLPSILSRDNSPIAPHPPDPTLSLRRCGPSSEACAKHSTTSTARTASGLRRRASHSCTQRSMLSKNMWCIQTCCTRDMQSTGYMQLGTSDFDGLSMLMFNTRTRRNSVATFSRHCPSQDGQHW
jgi:hypothetical protein